MHDPAFPALHIRPARGWLNDPNGLCRIDGTYHIFFQYNPHAPVHGNVHWGHVSSTDLLHWTEHEVALTPRPAGIDAAGCWSGCIVDDGGVPTALYTANPDHAWNATVGIARSDRALETWTQAEAPLVRTPDDPAIDEVRDPFVFSVEDRRYAVQGAGQRGGRPQLLLWNCDDLEHWVELGPLLTTDDSVAAEVAAADIWECPNLAYVDGTGWSCCRSGAGSTAPTGWMGCATWSGTWSARVTGCGSRRPAAGWSTTGRRSTRRS